MPRASRARQSVARVRLTERRHDPLQVHPGANGRPPTRLTTMKLLAERQYRQGNWPLPHELLWIWAMTGIMEVPIEAPEDQLIDRDEHGESKHVKLKVLDSGERIDACKASQSYFAPKQLAAAMRVEEDLSHAAITPQNAKEHLFARMARVLEGLTRASEARLIEGSQGDNE